MTHGHLVVVSGGSLLLGDIVVGRVGEHVPGRLPGSAGGDALGRRMSVLGLLPRSAKQAVVLNRPTIVGLCVS